MIHIIIFKYHQMNSSIVNHKFYKFIDEKWIQRGFLYKEGLNILDKPFEKHGSCVPGGLYFTDITKIFNYLTYGTRLVEVTIPIDAQVVIDDYDSHKWRADKIIIKNIGIITDIDTIKYLINEGANFTKHVPEFYNASIKNNNIALLKYLLKNFLKDSREMQKKIKNTTISHGFYEDEIIYLLIKYGAKIDDYFLNDLIEGENLILAKAILKYKYLAIKTLYILAGKYNKLRIIELVHRYFPQIKSYHNFNNEIFYYAVINDNINMIKYMIDNGFYFSINIPTFISNKKISNKILSYLNSQFDNIIKNNIINSKTKLLESDLLIDDNIIDYREHLEY
ncbi:putative ankyrin repeat protein [Megavirus chiliensis]|nr:putative ankyrin repeat protein [Megavirus chiliensis]